jgi:phospholipid/cholesterol/gamma-HCH transport system substrate-binding protein
MTRRLLAVVAAGTVLLTGCQGLYDVPLPGGAATGSDVYRVTVEFRDVLDLVPQSAVKVNDVAVGAVEKVWLDGYTAKVRLRVKDSVKLPDNAVAELRQTSLLGEKFVSLEPPPGATPTGRLGDGDVIPLARSGRNPEVEEVFSSLSLLLNGGGVAQLRTINVELSKAMKGRESDIRSAVRSLDTFIGSLDSHKAEVVRAIDGLDRLSSRLEAQKQDLAVALDDIPQGLKVLADQRADLTRMLQALSDLGVVGTRVIKASKDDFVANLHSLDPILTKLAQAGDDLPNALEVMFTYPFPRSALKGIKGDYTNLRADVDPASIEELIRSLPHQPTSPPTKIPTPTLPTVPTVPTLPTLPSVSVPVPAGCPTTPTVAGATLPAGCPSIPAAVGGLVKQTSYDQSLAVLLLGGYV